MKTAMAKYQYQAVFALILLLVFAGIWISKESGDGGKKPLYWVAPMDPNFRRDGPGKSPMGMDLVPVYEESQTANSGPGVVSIQPEVQNQMGVRTQVVEEGTLKQTLRTYGRVVFDQTLVAKLSPRVTGWVDMLFVDTEGEAVKRGQPLYALYSPELISAQESYLIALRGGNARDIAQKEAQLRALKMDDEAIRKLNTERVLQQSVIFRAPKDGVVGMLKVGEDYYVEPGDLIMAIGSLENVWVELNLFESQASLIKSNQLVSLSTPSYPGVVWEGEVDYIYPALMGEERGIKFRANIDNPKMRLKPNMHIQGLIDLPEREPALLVPRQAVISLAEQNRVVLNLGEGRFKSVEVVLGESNNRWVEVQEGIEEGDEIVTSAHFLIDSESSKTSDFKRMTALEDDGPKYPPTWVSATIKEINLVERKLKLTHDYIDAWKMPSMTMNFQATDDFNFKGLEVGDKVEVHITDGDPLFQVKDVKTEGAAGQQ